MNQHRSSVHKHRIAVVVAGYTTTAVLVSIGIITPHLPSFVMGVFGAMIVAAATIGRIDHERPDQKVVHRMTLETLIAPQHEMAYATLMLGIMAAIPIAAVMYVPVWYVSYVGPMGLIVLGTYAVAGMIAVLHFRRSRRQVIQA